jgi:hypothetical protein
MCSTISFAVDEQYICLKARWTNTVRLWAGSSSRQTTDDRKTLARLLSISSIGNPQESLIASYRTVMLLATESLGYTRLARVNTIFRSLQKFYSRSNNDLSGVWY